jgi:hypothetical protein
MKNLLIGFLILAFVGMGFLVGQKIEAQNKLNQPYGKLIMLCGASSSMIQAEMAPLVPIVARDNYGFVYLTYKMNINVSITFQFYNDRLQGIGIQR